MKQTEKCTRVYLNTAPPFVSYIDLPWSAFDLKVKGHVNRNIKFLQKYLTDPSSPLVALFTPEWTAKVAETVQALSKKRRNIFRPFPKTFDFTHCLPSAARQNQRPDVMDRSSVGASVNFHLSDLNPDDSSRPAILYISAYDSLDKARVAPYDMIFGGIAAVPVRKEFKRDPRRFYGMERVEHDRLRMWRKNGTDGEARVNGRLTQDFPPDLLYVLLRVVREANTKMDLIPMLLWCRLVNWNWHDIATELAIADLTLTRDKIPRFFTGPTSNLYRHVRHIHVHTRLPEPGALGSKDSHRCYHSHELQILDLLNHAPKLCEVEMLQAPSDNLPELHLVCCREVARVVARVVGWMGSTPSATTDALEPHLIRTLDLCTSELYRLASEHASSPRAERYWRRYGGTERSAYDRILHEQWSRTPMLFFCVSAPSIRIMEAIGRALQAFVSVHALVEPLTDRNDEDTEWTHRPVAPTVTFVTWKGWKIEEAVAWVKGMSSWVVEWWPPGTVVLVSGWGARGECVGLEWIVGCNWSQRWVGGGVQVRGDELMEWRLSSSWRGLR